MPSVVSQFGSVSLNLLKQRDIRVSDFQYISPLNLCLNGLEWQKSSIDDIVIKFREEFGKW